MACTKLFSGDLPELTNEIIKYFWNDFSTLHSCVLVNRLWCRLAITLLWENPFLKNNPKNYHFIEIYLNRLNDEDKKKLDEYGINNELFPSNTTFNYPSFIKCLNTQKVSSSIKTWVEIKTKFSNFNQYFKLPSFIFLSLIRIFIDNEVNLHTLEVEVSYTLENITNDCFKSVLQLMLRNPKFTGKIKNLAINFNRLASNLLSYLKRFNPICNSILSLYIHSSMDDYAEKDLSRIISLQQNLEKIYFNRKIYPLKSLKNSNCSNTLKVIIFYDIYFENLGVNFNEAFEQLNVLESIHILNCYPINTMFVQQIINLTKPFKLKSLFMDKRSVPHIDSLKLLLQKSGDHLEYVGFESSIDYELKLHLFKLFQNYCIKIKFLSLLGFDDKISFPALELVKEVQHNLNYLIINFSQFGYDQISYDDKLSSIILHNLGQILPDRLEYLSMALKFNINDLEVFFKNSQNVFIRKLLIRNKFYQENENVLPCIKEYVMKEKRVSYLAMENLPVTNNERRDLYYLKDEVKEFKLYDIQVKKYNYLCIQVSDFINESY
jgi:hypothetical protein